MKKLMMYELQEGMKVAKEITTSEGVIIISKGILLTKPVISRLAMLGITEVCVEDEIEDFDAVAENRRYQYKTLRKRYSTMKDKLNKSFAKLLSDEKDKEQVMEVAEESWSFFEKNQKKCDMLSVLYSMHDYQDATYLHSMNVGVVAALLGKWLGWSKQDQKLLNLCGIFHDTGKLLIPAHIIKKPGRLTDDEYEIMKKHPLYGYNLLKEAGVDEVIARAALMHHERCDGKGYPIGYKSDKIDKYSKVIAIADVYEAMTADRVYRKGMSPFDVIDFFEHQGLCVFEPEYLLKFLTNMVNTYVNTDVELNTGEKAEVVLINRIRNSRPLVITSSGKAIDLSREKNIRIDKVFTV